MESERPGSEDRPLIARPGMDWLGDLGANAAKMGLALYLVGLITSSFYYSRFSILTLDFAKTQSILIGVYVALLYTIFPAMILLLLRGVSRTGVIPCTFFSLLLVVDISLGLALEYRRIGLLMPAIVTALLQAGLFCEFVSLRESLKNRKLLLAFLLKPSRLKMGVFLVLVCTHFSTVWFPRIPAYFGGGKPIRVQVFTKTADLPANRFVRSKNKPQINKSMDSYSLQLLYETDKEDYFLYDLKAEDALVGYSVMRIKKDEILRIDYTTPKWVQWEGEK